MREYRIENHPPKREQTAKPRRVYDLPENTRILDKNPKFSDSYLDEAQDRFLAELEARVKRNL